MSRKESGPAIGMQGRVEAMQGSVGERMQRGCRGEREGRAAMMGSQGEEEEERGGAARVQR
jgi:hypothetical protein